MLSTLEADRALVTTLEAQNLDLRVDVDLKRSLSALRIEQALAQERLDSYKYPVLTLPNEILCEIFERFLPPYPLCPPLTGNLSPTFLTQICRKWRQVALATPTLWRAITLSFYRIPFERQGQISDFLTRSGSCPLSIRNDDIGLSEPITEVFSTVALHRARWEYLYLSLSPWQLPSINGPMPLLRHLRLSVNNPEEAGAIAFRDMPLLRSVVLDEYASSSVKLPWAQLTSLTLNNVWRSEYLPILQEACNLRQCELGILWVFRDGVPPGEITLPHLESLALDDSNHDWEGSYSDVFRVSALRSLRIPRSFLGPEPIDTLKSFISKSGSNPQEVCIVGEDPVTSGSYHQAFTSIPIFSFMEETRNSDSSEFESSDSSW